MPIDLGSYVDVVSRELQGLSVPRDLRTPAEIEKYHALLAEYRRLSEVAKAAFDRLSAAQTANEAEAVVEVAEGKFRMAEIKRKEAKNDVLHEARGGVALLAAVFALMDGSNDKIFHDELSARLDTAIQAGDWDPDDSDTEAVAYLTASRLKNVLEEALRLADIQKYAAIDAMKHAASVDGATEASVRCEAIRNKFETASTAAGTAWEAYILRHAEL